jgi:DNA-binding response OmpR family regulator
LSNGADSFSDRRRCKLAGHDRPAVEKEGFRPGLAEDDKTGFKQALTLKPGLILVDLRMPGMSGLEPCKQLRAVGRGKAKLCDGQGLSIG